MRLRFIALCVALALTTHGTAAEPGNPLDGISPPQLIQDGYKKADTPAWLPAQGVLLFTDLELGKQYQLTPPDQIKVIREGASRGKVGPDGRFYGVLDGAIADWTPGGAKNVILEKAAGGREISLNDLAVSSKGQLYFSTLKDPQKGRLSVVDLKQRTVQVAWDGEDEETLWNPNGVALSPDEKYLYVGISSYKNRKHSGVYRFPIREDGSLDVAAGKAEKWAAVKAPDGIAVDKSGNVFFTAGGKIHVFAPGGRRWGTIKIPKGSGTNLTFGGPDGRTLYVTTWNALYAIPLSGN